MTTSPTNKSIDAFVKQGLQYASSLNDEIIISSRVEKLEQFRFPCRIDAITVLIILDGKMECNINLKHYNIEQTGILINFPENIICINSARDIKAYAVILSADYLNKLQVALAQRINSYIKFKRSPFYHVPYASLASLKSYYVLIKWQMDNPGPETRNIVASRVESFLYHCISLVRKAGDSDHDAATSRQQSSRMLELFDRFMSLLARYHTQQRSIGFYAGKLCVSVNYLSTVVKNYTGKTAGSWIDEYVILEAKSLLRFSGLNIQQIAYRLNFPTQSAFGKYFKNKTGLSPKRFMCGVVHR